MILRRSLSFYTQMAMHSQQKVDRKFDIFSVRTEVGEPYAITQLSKNDFGTVTVVNLFIGNVRTSFETLSRITNRLIFSLGVATSGPGAPVATSSSGDFAGNGLNENEFRPVSKLLVSLFYAAERCRQTSRTIRLLRERMLMV